MAWEGAGWVHWQTHCVAKVPVFLDRRGSAHKIYFVNMAHSVTHSHPIRKKQIFYATITRGCGSHGAFYVFFGEKGVDVAHLESSHFSLVFWVPLLCRQKRHREKNIYIAISLFVALQSFGPCRSRCPLGFSVSAVAPSLLPIQQGAHNVPRDIRHYPRQSLTAGRALPTRARAQCADIARRA